jgi:hypothetical protein
MKEEQNPEIMKLKATVFDIIERMEMHQLEVQKLDEIRKNVINKIKELREASKADVKPTADAPQEVPRKEIKKAKKAKKSREAAKTSTDDSINPAPQDIEINDISEENKEIEDKQEKSSTE